MDFTGKRLSGFLYIDIDGLQMEAQLEKWMLVGVRFATAPEEAKSSTKSSTGAAAGKASNKRKAPAAAAAATTATATVASGGKKATKRGSGAAAASAAAAASSARLKSPKASSQSSSTAASLSPHLSHANASSHLLSERVSLTLFEPFFVALNSLFDDEEAHSLGILRMPQYD
jgi:hypothetical protein